MVSWMDSWINVAAERLARQAAAGAVALALASPLLASAPTDAAELRQMVADLRGGQAVPVVTTPARGSAVFRVDTDANTVTYRIALGGLSAAETAAHIHGPADPGTSGGVKHTLPAGPIKTGVWTYSEADEADILAGKMYVNVHTVAHPGGEIRGQIGDFVADLSGLEAGTGSTGAGWGVFSVDTDANELRYHVAIESLTSTETAAHIHGYALHGASAGVVHGLGVGAVKSGTWNYSDGDEAALLEGRAYVNVHTTAFGAGEIRGQIVRGLAVIDGMQAVPPSTSAAVGTGYFALDTANDQLSYAIHYAGLVGSETAAHIHGFAPPGSTAGVVHGLPAGQPKLGLWSYAAGQEDPILNGLSYVNVHTTAFPGGEIRGQVLLPLASPPCDGDIDGDGSVGVGDLLAVLAAWGPCAGCPEDIDEDGAVAVGDLLIVLGAWGACE